jgi:hypothetical protein
LLVFSQTWLYKLAQRQFNYNCSLIASDFLHGRQLRMVVNPLYSMSIGRVISANALREGVPRRLGWTRS